jgi:hypothetical protein
MITWLESNLYLNGEGSGWKVDWANRKEGQGGISGNASRLLALPEDNIP